MIRKCKKHGCDMIVKEIFSPTEKFKHGSLTVYCPECEKENGEGLVNFCIIGTGIFLFVWIVLLSTGLFGFGGIYG